MKKQLVLAVRLSVLMGAPANFSPHLAPYVRGREEKPRAGKIKTVLWKPGDVDQRHNMYVIKPASYSSWQSWTTLIRFLIKDLKHGHMRSTNRYNTPLHTHLQNTESIVAKWWIIKWFVQDLLKISQQGFFKLSPPQLKSWKMCEGTQPKIVRKNGWWGRRINCWTRQDKRRADAEREKLNERLSERWVDAQ